MSLKTAVDRNPRFDNARLLLITLVVIGHFLEVFYDSNIYALQAWRFIYAFHMPAFVFLAGFYARPDNPAKTLQNVKKLFVPLLLFSIVYEGSHFAFKGEMSNYVTHFSPYWSLWFLLSLIIWTVSLPYVLALRFPFATLVALSLAAGLIEPIDYTMSLSRVFVFFPFFLMGFRFAENKLFDSTPLRNPVYILLALLFIVSVLPLIDALQINQRMLLGGTSYSKSELSWLQGMVMRIELLTIATLALLSFFIFVPRNENRFTVLGQNSIVVYLLHVIFVRAFEYFGNSSHKHLDGFEAVAFSIVLGLIVTWILSAKPVRSVYDRCMTAFNG